MLDDVCPIHKLGGVLEDQTMSLVWADIIQELS